MKISELFLDSRELEVSLYNLTLGDICLLASAMKYSWPSLTSALEFL
jgi:hypothetical protein